MIKVSILIPCYNAEQWIAQAIESAINQTYPHTEVIVVDDGSTDRSLEIIKSFGDAIRWETGINRGGNVARNKLLELSTGEWLQYLDADDYLLPDKIERQVKFLDKKSSGENIDIDIDIIYSPVIAEYYCKNNPAQEYTRELNDPLVTIPEPHDHLTLLIRWQLPQTGACLWRKQAIIEVGGWKENQVCCQEHELYSRLLMNKKKFLFCQETYAVYRVFNGQTISTKNISITYKNRLEIIEKIQEYIKNINNQNPLYFQIINQVKFDCARAIWLFDKEWAIQIVNTVNQNSDFFIPTGKNATHMYRFFYRLLGFSLTEEIALVTRLIRKLRLIKFNFNSLKQILTHYK
ncbi:MAG: glycosyltransferase family 2 protein [Gloeotrichia echinulata GP01]|jgi:glycosyltransferase involved in cell wall biosynthesis